MLWRVFNSRFGENETRKKKKFDIYTRDNEIKDMWSHGKRQNKTILVCSISHKVRKKSKNISHISTFIGWRALVFSWTTQET